MNRYHIYASPGGVNPTYRYADAVRMVLMPITDFHPGSPNWHNGSLPTVISMPARSSGKMAEPLLQRHAQPHALCHAEFHRRGGDIATMAHELGHAVHAMMAEQHNVFTFHSTLRWQKRPRSSGNGFIRCPSWPPETNRAVKQSLLVNQLMTFTPQSR